MRPVRPRTVELWLVVLVSVHSLAVGVSLLFFPQWSAALGGWGEVEHTFFPRQGGVFHLNADFYKKSGGVLTPSLHYEEMFKH